MGSGSLDILALELKLLLELELELLLELEDVLELEDELELLVLLLELDVIGSGSLDTLDDELPQSPHT